MKMKWILFFLSFFFFLGCSAIEKNQFKPLNKIVFDFMQAKVDEDWGKMYDFISSDYKNKVTKEKFLHIKRGLKINKFIIEKIDIALSEKEAKVNIKNEIVMQGYTFKDAPEIQIWIKEDGQWRFKMPSSQLQEPQK